MDQPDVAPVYRANPEGRKSPQDTGAGARARGRGNFICSNRTPRFNSNGWTRSPAGCIGPRRHGAHVCMRMWRVDNGYSIKVAKRCPSQAFRTSICLCLGACWAQWKLQLAQALAVKVRKTSWPESAQCESLADVYPVQRPTKAYLEWRAGLQEPIVSRRGDVHA